MNDRTFIASLLAAVAVAVAAQAQAAPITPSHDAQVIETLPAKSAARAEERRLRKAVQGNPRDAQSAVQLARQLMDEARELGDPRLAGQAMAALQPWTDPATAPTEVLLMQAVVKQFLHDFDGSAHLLERSLAREPRQPQAWLTLATVRRVQGRYTESDRACQQLVALGAAVHGPACLAENEALRGDLDAARQRLRPLLADPKLDANTRNWLLTSVAELEERAGRNEAADAAYKAALAASNDGYSLVAYADFLIGQGRHRDALALLREHPRTDVVLLRLAIAGTRSKAPHAAADAAEMRERITQANLRPQAQTVHGREQALFALWVDAEPQRAVVLARNNVLLQREPIDLLVLAQAAAAARDAAARQEADRLRKELGLHDRRLDALL